MEENPYKAPVARGRRHKRRFTWFDDLALALTAIFVLAGIAIALFGPVIDDFARGALRKNVARP